MPTTCDPQTLRIDSGQILFRQNDPSRELYIVQSGALRVFRQVAGREIELSRLGRGSVVGEMAMIDGKPRSASAMALEPCTVTVVPANAFERSVAGVPSWFLSVFRVISEKLRQVDARLGTTGEARGGAILEVMRLLYGRYSDGRVGRVVLEGYLRRLFGAVPLVLSELLTILEADGIIAARKDGLHLVSATGLRELVLLEGLLKAEAMDEPIASSVLRVVREVAAAHPLLLQDIDGYTLVARTSFDEMLGQCAAASLATNGYKELRDLGLLAQTDSPEVHRLANRRWARIYLQEKYRQAAQLL